MPSPARPRRSLACACLLAVAAACGCAAPRPAPPSAPTVLAAQRPGDELYEVSPARVMIRRLGPQAVRLLAPHWSRVRETDRKVLQATLVQTVSEDRVAPFVKASLRQAADADPAMAAQAIAWLKSDIGYEVKFAEATAWNGDKRPEDTFYASVAEVKDNRTPEIRMERIRRLAAATDALSRTLDLTTAVGTVVARLVNVARPEAKALPLPALDAAIARERKVPAVADAYRAVVEAALLVRCRELDLQELDAYIAFAESDAGRWYQGAIASALVAGVDSASMDVEGVFEANAHSGEPEPESPGFDLDSLLLPLSSGRSVRLLAMAQTGPDEDPAVVLRYETSLPLANAAAVGGEAREVWDKVRGQLEAEGARAAVLQATGSVDGWVFPFASTRKYGWRREASGEWLALAAGRGSFGEVEREMLWSLPP